MRGLSNLYHIQADDPRITGDYTVVLNADWDQKATGPVWGTFTCDRPDGGQWSGVFYGWRYEVSDTEWESVFHEFSYGSAGNIDGLRFDSTETVRSNANTTISDRLQGRIYDGDPD
jgi:hypothetical protein